MPLGPPFTHIPGHPVGDVHPMHFAGVHTLAVACVATSTIESGRTLKSLMSYSSHGRGCFPLKDHPLGYIYIGAPSSSLKSADSKNTRLGVSTKPALRVAVMFVQNARRIIVFVANRLTLQDNRHTFQLAQ